MRPRQLVCRRCLVALILLISSTLATPGNGATASSPAPSRPTPPRLEALPAPKAAGPLRVLLVDDDWSGNNAVGSPAPQSASDKVLRELLARVVGEVPSDAVVVVWQHRHGPSLDRLRDYNLILWYTGASYGGGYDNSAVLSLQDEQTVRAYLEQVGGAVVLLSPGYLSNHQYASTWTSSRHGFIKEVLGADGAAGLVQRFRGGPVIAADGSRFTVADKGGVETQFSAANATTAAVVFTASLDPRRTSNEPAPVALSHPYGAGRFVYVGFTLENLPEPERELAFRRVLDATGLQPSGPRAVAITSTPMILPTVATPGLVQAPPAANPPTYTRPGELQQTSDQRLRPLEAPPPGPAPLNLAGRSAAADYHSISWSLPENVRSEQADIYLKQGDRWVLFAEKASSAGYHRKYILPNSVFQVVLRYADGSVGVGEFTFATPTQPKQVVEVRYEQVRTRTVKITWQGQPWEEGDKESRVFADGLPPEGVTALDMDRDRQDRRWVTITNIPEGVHRFRIGYRYTLPSPIPDYEVDITVAPQSDGYRLLLLGFRAERVTPDDDIFGGDGRGDEIFFGAFQTRISMEDYTKPAPGAVVKRTVVMGDTQAFPTRQRAGTASPQGGIKDGDVMPSDSSMVAQPGRLFHDDRLPWLLWEGRLLEEAPPVVIGLSAFKWDNTNENAWNAWSNYWQRRNFASHFNLAAAIAADRGRVEYARLSLPEDHGIDFPAANRPLGTARSSLGSNTWHWTPYGLVLDQAVLEQMLGPRDAVVFGFPLATQRHAGADDGALKDPASYLVYFQLERTPPVTAHQLGANLGPWEIVKPKPPEWQRRYRGGPDRSKFGK